ncbi:MAG: hypothetical protein COA78_16685 [Blastopirellula sp.]|nr:MAG: hypothetical protein COA78_16685 [Blastopirellula sp.]
MSHNTKSGFTLKELFVVIGLIALLLAVLLPMLNQSRTPARRSLCMNNQKQMNIAVKNYYSRSSSNTRPSVITPASRTAQVQYSIKNGHSNYFNWVVPLLYDLDEGHLDARYRQSFLEESINPISVLDGESLPLMICSSDPPKNNQGNPMSYFVNSGIRNSYSIVNNESITIDLAANGLWSDKSNLSNQSGVRVQGIPDGESNTILLSERLRSDQHPDFPARWNRVDLNPKNNYFPVESQSSILWEESPVPGTVVINNKTKSPITNTLISSNHPGGANVSFCDGSSRFLSEKINAQVFARLMTSDGRRSRLDTNGDSDFKEEANLPWQNKPLNPNDF